MSVFKAGDLVAVFDSIYPEGPHLQHAVSRVTRRTLRLKGDPGPSIWQPDGRHQISSTLRLVHIADLPAAQEEALRRKAEREALRGALRDVGALANEIFAAGRNCKTAAEVRAKVAEVLRAALAEWGAP